MEDNLAEPEASDALKHGLYHSFYIGKQSEPDHNAYSKFNVLRNKGKGLRLRIGYGMALFNRCADAGRTLCTASDDPQGSV